jgi:hypothetical protein
MQPLPPEQQPQAITLQDNPANNPQNDTGVDIVQWFNPLPAINEERYVMSGDLAAAGALSSPALAHTRRSEKDARMEGMSPHRMGVEGVGTSEEDIDSVGMAYGGVEEPVARGGMENERNMWTTVSTFANNGPLEPLTCKPGRELTPSRTSESPARPAKSSTTPSTESEFTDVDLHGETSAEGETGNEKRRRRSGKTKEQRDRERREKALSEASAKLEGTWKGDEEQEWLEKENGGAIDYIRLGFE